MRHMDVKKSLTDYLEGELDLDRRTLVDRHLEACEDCSRELAELRHAVFLLRRLPTPEPPPTLVADVVRRIGEGEAQPGVLFYLRRGWDSFVVALEPPRVTAPVIGLAAGLAIVLAMGDYGLQLPGFGSEGADSVQEDARIEAVTPNASARLAASGRGWKAQRGALVASASANTRGPRERLDLRGSVSSEPLLRGGGATPGVAMVAAGAHQPGALAGLREADLRDADGWIEVVVTRPVDFAREHARLTELEQELWVTHLGFRAEETGRLGDVVAALQLSREKRAAALAAAFSESQAGDSR
ncbi:MAG: zf-HC2 domain-containing protein [Myxococcota bacterium]